MYYPAFFRTSASPPPRLFSELCAVFSLHATTMTPNLLPSTTPAFHEHSHQQEVSVANTAEATIL